MTQSPPERSEVPGFRALRSPRFRLLIALVLAVYGVALDVFLIETLGELREWFEDYAAYIGASQRLLDGASAYTADQLASSIHAVCPGCYLYPPTLAQVLGPLDWLPAETAEMLWFLLLTLAGFGAVWIAGSVGGAQRTLERGLWTIVAVTLFFPIFQSNWLGNVSTLMALGVALTAYGGAIAGVAVAVGFLIKLVPGAFMPAVFMAGRPSRLALVGTLAGFGLLLFVFSPESWLDYPTVLMNLTAGGADVHWNVAPAVVVEQAGLGEGIVELVRAGTLVVAGLALLASVWLARRSGGMPAAAVAATVTMLLVPGTLWYHYLAVSLPIAAMAWPRAGGRVRIVLLVALALVSAAGLIFTPVVIVTGTAVVLATAGYVLWPTVRSGPLHRAGQDLTTIIGP